MNSRQHLVLRSKVTGKIASRKDQEMIALRLKAIQLSASGRDGGVLSLLLPQTKREATELQRASLRYDVVEVRKRSTGERERVREALEKNDALMVGLAELYLRAIKHSAYKILVSKFAIWVCAELEIHNSDVSKLVFSNCPALADRHSPSWWEKQIAQRRRNLKKIQKEKNVS